MTEAGELRQAASLIRARATPCDQGPWSVVPDTAKPGTEVNGANWSICRAHDDEAAHIASWSPIVALAVARLLDEMAAELDEVPAGALSASNPAPALAVARAYLGSDR